MRGRASREGPMGRYVSDEVAFRTLTLPVWLQLPGRSEPEAALTLQRPWELLGLLNGPLRKCSGLFHE